MIPRAVIITRPTEYEAIATRYGGALNAVFIENAAVANTAHRRMSSGANTLSAGTATRAASINYLSDMTGTAIAGAQRVSGTVKDIITYVSGAIPSTWRKASVDRSQVSRFVFEETDVIICVGQDGLVANVAKYLEGQPVIGLNPFNDRSQALCSIYPYNINQILETVYDGSAVYEPRSMVQVTLEDGRSLIGLNELFCGQQTHQSAKYEIACKYGVENQSSSGVIVYTGTGSSGWASSIASATHSQTVTDPVSNELGFFVREAWRSSWTGATVTQGIIGAGDDFAITSQMGEHGIIFADGIEDDYLDFQAGSIADFGLAPHQLNMVKYENNPPGESVNRFSLGNIKQRLNRNAVVG